MDIAVPLRSARFRVGACALVGTAVAIGVAPFAPWQLSLLAGWNTLAVVMLVWIWLEAAGCSASQTRERATVEDNSRGAAVAVMVAASTMSLVGVAFGLAKANKVDQPVETLLTVASVLTVVLSWCVVHSNFMLRYAHLFYSASGGVEFPGDEPPDYRDFAYLAFTVGMAFAVSDTPVAGRRMRRAVTQHALVSYVFGAVIVGLAINVTAGLIR